MEKVDFLKKVFYEEHNNYTSLESIIENLLYTLDDDFWENFIVNYFKKHYTKSDILHYMDNLTKRDCNKLYKILYGNEE